MGEVSALRFGRLHGTGSHAKHIIVGFWDEFQVQVYTVSDLTPVGTPVTLSNLPRSLVMVDLKGNSDSLFVVVGQGDGIVVAVPFSKVGLHVADKKISSLGDSPVHLSTCVVGGRNTVIANGTRCSMVSWKSSLEFTPILLKVGGTIE